MRTTTYFALRDQKRGSSQVQKIIRIISREFIHLSITLGQTEMGDSKLIKG
jgi:hypothetical protein